MSPQNTFGVSGVNSAAARSNTWNINVGACGHLEDNTRAVWRNVMFLSVVLIRLKKRSPRLQHCLPLRLLKCFVDSST